MQRQIIERYLKEVPFMLIPLLITFGAVLLTRFVVIPQYLTLQEVTEKMDALPELYSEQQKLMTRLNGAVENLPATPEYESLEFSDGASLIQALFDIAKKLNITFTRTQPSVENGIITVQTGFSSNFDKFGSFLTALERYPLQISVSQVAVSRRKGALMVKLTVTGFPEKGKK